MKKSKLILFVILIMSIFIAKPQALDNLYNLDWQSEKQKSYDKKDYDDVLFFSFKDNHILKFSYEEDDSDDYYVNATHYDKDGNVLASKKLPSFYDVFVDDKYIYVCTYGEEDDYKLIKYDEKFNELANITITGYDSASIIGLTDDKVILFVYTYEYVEEQSKYEYFYLEVDKNLEHIDTFKETEDTATKYSNLLYGKYFNNDMSLEKLQNNFKKIREKYGESYIEKIDPRGYIVLNVIDRENYTNDKLIVLDFNLNEIIVKNTNYDDDDEPIKDIVILDNNIAIVYEKNREFTDDSKDEYYIPNDYINIYDLNGKFIETIDNDVTYYGLTAINGGFVVEQSTHPGCTAYIPVDVSSIDTMRPACTLEYSTVVYKLTYNIKTNVTGDGQIEVQDKAMVGDEVKFNIIPSNDWILSKIIIKDSQGNIIEYKDNSFIMPDSDVTIEVTFEIENPNTSDIWISGITIITIILGIILIKNKKKLKFLK